MSDMELRLTSVFAILGSACNDGSSKSPCNTGEYALEGASACTPCPAGYECPNKNAHPVPCPAGKKPNGSKTGCDSCTGATYCTDPANPQTCAGKVVNSAGVGNIGCEPCPAGYSCSGGSASACNSP